MAGIDVDPACQGRWVRVLLEFLAKGPSARNNTEYAWPQLQNPCAPPHPVGAVHVAWQEAPDWAVNPYFAREVLAEAKSRERPIFLICRSGRRTLDAGRALETDGFSDVTNVLHGFEGDLDERSQRGNRNGWRHDGLPWEQM